MARTRPRPEVAAAIDVGSYSVHLLVAEVGRHRLAERLDESAYLGLGRELDVAGSLGPARDRLVETLVALVGRARAIGAGTITIVGTDPLRRARDAADVIADIQEATGVDVEVLSHDEEALASLIGVQAGRPVLRDIAVVDAGGGSTEMLVAGPARETIAIGLPLGVTRLTGRYVKSDPPSSAQVRAMTARVRAVMRGAPEAQPALLMAVGGTARNLLRIGPRLANRTLTRRRIRRALRVIEAASAEATAERYAIKLSRAKVLAAGAAIFLAALDHYHLDRLSVARGGLREGLILAAHQGGPAWRDQIRDLARGWDR
jgi:exopolyphosphatase/guanosine-5'-triphosphate,3'-diphosphate pyrophosphatase